MKILLAAGIVQTALSSMQLLVFAALGVGALICLAFAAIFGGHHDGDVGHGDHGGDHGDGHESTPSFLSPRVFFAFLAGFGLSGAISTAYGATTVMATLVGFIPGFVMAFLAWSFSYFLHKQQVNSSLRPGQAIGAVGTVVTAIQAEGLGEVDVNVGGQTVSYSAMSDDGKPIRMGTRVRVTEEVGGRVTVRNEAVATR